MPWGHEADAKVFKALCNEHRLRALEMLRTGGKCACDPSDRLDISPSTLSHRMTILVESGIVASRQEGKWVRYSISAEGSRVAMALLAELTDAKAGARTAARCAE